MVSKKQFRYPTYREYLYRWKLDASTPGNLANLRKYGLNPPTWKQWGSSKFPTKYLDSLIPSKGKK